MPRMCTVCGKGTSAGQNVSHAMNATKRRFQPNLKRVRVSVGTNMQRAWICARCLKTSKKITTSTSNNS